MHDSVRALMVPSGKFPTIRDTATFSEAVLALEQAQQDYQTGKCEQRILLVQDQSGKVVGKLSPTDVIRGLEPDFDRIVNPKASSFISSGYVIDAMKDLARLWSTPLDDLCATAKDVRVKDFLRKPAPSQVIGIDDTLNSALHRFVLLRHDSLFVTEGNRLVGLLRFSDVYREIGRRIKDVCSL